MEAKRNGDKIKNETLKLSINGAYGMFGNFYSWLFDHRVRLQICVNGQLMLAMLTEKCFKLGIQLIDINTDGLVLKVHKDQLEALQSIVKEWETTTLMEMEWTKFESLHMLNTADYFGTYLEKGKLKTKLKGIFDCDDVKLGKGMEFAIVPKSIRKYFLEGVSFEKTIRTCDNILDFCSYKKLNRDAECYHNNKLVQRTNRFYACKSGAFLLKRSFDQKKQKWGNMSHLLKDSPVIIYNKFDDKDISERGINYEFYVRTARNIIHSIEGTKTLF